jgi:NADH dehydrogenase
VYSFKELLQRMASVTKRTPCLISMPSALASLQGLMCELLPFSPMITRDQVKLLAYDNVATAGAPGFEALGITPSAIETQLTSYLSRFVKE